MAGCTTQRRPISRRAGAWRYDVELPRSVPRVHDRMQAGLLAEVSGEKLTVEFVPSALKMAQFPLSTIRDRAVRVVPAWIPNSPAKATKSRPGSRGGTVPSRVDAITLRAERSATSASKGAEERPVPALGHAGHDVAVFDEGLVQLVKVVHRDA